VIRKVLANEFPNVQSSYGTLTGTADVVPKSVSRLPILITGSSRQSFEWIAAHADGWITYPREFARQSELVAKWRAAVDVVSLGVFKPFVQSLYVDLADDPAESPRPIYLGFRAGRDFMIGFLNELAGAGVNHVILNLKYGRRAAGDVLEEIDREVIPRLAERRGTTPLEAPTAS
jgi:luciferase-type oxidoreductase